MVQEQAARDRAVARRTERKAAYSAFIAEANAVNEAALRMLMASGIEAQSADPLAHYQDPQHVEEDVAFAQRRLTATLGPHHGVSDEAVAAILNNSSIRRSVLQRTGDELVESVRLDLHAGRERYDAIARLVADVRLVGSPEVNELTTRLLNPLRLLLSGFMSETGQGRGLDDEAKQLGKGILHLESVMAKDLADLV